MPSHALPSGRETRIRRRGRRRRLRDWGTFGAFLMVLMAALSLSGGIVGHLWPKAHGIGYVVTHVVVRGILIGAVGAVLVVVAMLAAVVRGRRLRP